MTKQYRSEAMASIHEMAESLHVAGLIGKQTMRHFDEACLTPVRGLTAKEIRALREPRSGGWVVRHGIGHLCRPFEITA